MIDFCPFYIGQRVVCIDATPIAPSKPMDMDGLIEDDIYTIRWVGPMTTLQRAKNKLPPSIIVRLSEIDRTHRGWLGDEEVGFLARRFRPITDITIFERMLVELPVLENV